jgi:hypothetical protein
MPFISKIESPCLNCGADQSSDFKYYDGCLGYDAIICQKCGFIYDASGAHEPDKDEKSIMYVQVDQEALAKRKRLRELGPAYFEACKEAVNALNQIPNTKIGGRFKDTYAVCSYLDKVIKAGGCK